jgi:hypothetical protein
MRPFAALVLASSAAACAPAVPLVVVNLSSTEPRPASEVVSEAAVTPREGAGAILVTRPDVWLLGKRCTYDVALDDQHVAGLRPGEQVAIYADPGERVLAIRIRDEGGCEPATAQVPLKIVSHATNRVRVESDVRYDLKVEVNAYGGALPR